MELHTSPVVILLGLPSDFHEVLDVSWVGDGRGVGEGPLQELRGGKPEVRVR